MRIGLLTGVTLLIVATSASADEPDVYESFAGIEIGRVFLAPGDRERLDRNRLNPPAATQATGPEAERPPEQTRQVAAAGYIISSSGRARVWQDGEFIESRHPSTDKMAFPGDVTITRTQVVEQEIAEEEQPERRREADSDAE